MSATGDKETVAEKPKSAKLQVAKVDEPPEENNTKIDVSNDDSGVSTVNSNTIFVDIFVIRLIKFV